MKRTRNPYVLRGRLVCGVCCRRMQGHWAHESAYYRCRYPSEYALANHIDHPRNVYLREQWVLPRLDDWLATLFLPHRIGDTVDLMSTSAAASPTGSPDATDSDQARATIADCDAKLATHRAALEAGADPAVVTQWIAHTQARRARAEAELRATSEAPGITRTRMSRDEIARLVDSIKDLAAAVHQAAPEDKTEIYQRLGLTLTYHPGQQKVLAEIDPDQHTMQRMPHDNRGLSVRVRGGT